MIEQDFADMGLDLGDDGLIEHRSWRWFVTRLGGLITRPAVGYVQTQHPSDKTKAVNSPLYSSRLQRHFLTQR